MSATQVREIIRRNKIYDKIFSIVGLFGLLIAMLTLTALLLDLAVNGAPRLSWQFLTNFPSRFAEQAGVLSSIVGSLLVMVITAGFSVAFGVGAGVYLEEYAPKNWLTDLIEINIANLAGVPSIVYGLMALGLFV